MVVKFLIPSLLATLMWTGVSLQASASLSLNGDGVDTSKVGVQQVDIFGVGVGANQKYSGSIERPRVAYAVPKGYNGYMIQVLACYNKPLDASHEIFDRHGKIKMQRTNGDTYKYFICPTDKLAAIEDVYIKSIKPQYADAKIVRFDNGVIVEVARD